MNMNKICKNPQPKNINILPHLIFPKRQILNRTLMEKKVNIPASTVNISFDQDIKNEDGSISNHFQDIPYFKRFTLDEIRYYDYLSEGYISIVPNDEPQQNIQQCFNLPKQISETNIIYHQVSPWSIGFKDIPKIESIPNAQQPQPYGTLPNPNFSQMQFQQENIQNQQQVPFDPGISSPTSLFQQWNDYYQC